MKKEVIISSLIYILIVVFVIVGIPFFSENVFNSLSDKSNKAFSKTIYKIPHQYNQENSEQNKFLIQDNQNKPEVSEYMIEEEHLLTNHEEPKITFTNKPVICLVIDDFGYSGEDYLVKAIREIPITVAIIPFLDYSKKFYRIARQNNREVLIHIPMEAHNNEFNEKKYIKTTMSKEEIMTFLEKAFSEIDGDGINNHMGSRATEDERVMEIVMSFIKEKGKVFLDSYTSPRSVGFKKAEQYGLPPLKRDVFLDNSLSKYYIMDQLKNVEDIAKRRGYCIAIGHARKETISVIEEWYEKNKNNFHFLTLNELSNLMRVKMRLSKVN